MNSRTKIFTGLSLAGLAVLIISLFSIVSQTATAIDIKQGKVLYNEYCAACHGAKLEGQPSWQEQLPSGRLPAPPHDASGHTWHHADGLLLKLVKQGTAVVVGRGYQSDMPGFKDVLSDDEIVAILEYIKSTWPERERKYQERINQNERKAQK